MSPRRIAAGRAGAIKAVIALVAASACLGAVAYAATGTGSREIDVAGRKLAVGASPPAGSPTGRGRQERLPRVSLIETPASSSTAAEAQFRFRVPSRAKETGEPSAPPAAAEAAPTTPRRFQCSLDGGRWVACDSPHQLVGLSPGAHSFAVRALARDGRSGPNAAFGWQQFEAVSVRQAESVEEEPFSIEQTAALSTLYPGDPAQQVPLAIGNPNPVPIEVTSLTVTTGGAPGCAPENFQLTGSSASPEAPLVVPAEATVELPSAGTSSASIALRDLPVNQDACQGAEIELDLSGEARG